MKNRFFKKLIAIGLAVTTAIAAMGTSALAAQSTQYTGKPIKPNLELYDDDILLVEGVDYDLDYEDNINVGTGYIVVTYKGNYEGVKRIPFEITPRTLSSDDGKTIVSDIADVTFTGNELKPVPDVTYKDTELVPDVDFEMSYSGNVNVGAAEAIVNFIGNYTGQVLKSFNIKVLALTQDDLTILPIADVVYTGEPLSPEPVIEYGDTILEKDKDYTLTYSNNTNIGTGNIEIKLIGNYSGDVQVSFRVVEKVLTDDDVIVSDIHEQIYTGTPIEPKPEVKVEDKVLTEGTDYELVYEDNTDTGKAKMDIIFKGDYSGKVSRDYAIVSRILSDDDVAVTIGKQTYTGNPITPEVTVKVGDTTLEKDKDYTVEYSDNTEVGTAKATVKFIGNYTGEVEKTFEIEKKASTSSGGGGGGGSSYKYAVKVTDNNGKYVYPSKKETTDTITLTLPSSRTLDDENVKYTVVVKDKKNKALEGKTVIIVDKNKKQVTGVTDANGTVVLPEDEVAPIVEPEIIEHSSYISGYLDGSFNPDGYISRSETAAMLYRTLPERYADELAKAQDEFSDYFETAEIDNDQALSLAGGIFDVAMGEGEELPSDIETLMTDMLEILAKNLPFTISDVKEFKDMVPDAWYTDSINAMTAIGFINGYTDGTFRPDNYITRAEFVTMIMQNTDIDEIKDLPFTDVTDDMWSGKYIFAAYKAGYISGYEDGTFLPDANITRAEAVAIINRMLGRADLHHETVLPFNDVKNTHWAYDDISEASVSHTIVADIDNNTQEEFND